MSRALVGNELADQLNFPAQRLPFPLFWYKLDQNIRGLRARLAREGPNTFATLLVASAFDEAGLRYDLPDHAHDERSSKW